MTRLTQLLATATLAAGLIVAALGMAGPQRAVLAIDQLPKTPCAFCTT